MKLKLLGFSFIALLLASCGGSNSTTKDEPVLIKPTQTTIKGDLRDCFEVVDKSYEVKWNSYGKTITVEIKRTDAELPFSRDDFDVYEKKGDNPKSSVVGIGIELIDSMGNVVNQIAPNSTNIDEDLLIAAMRLNSGETAVISWDLSDKWDYGITGFRLSSSVEKNTKEKGDLFDQAVDKWSGENSKTDNSEKSEKGSEKGEDADIGEAIEATKDLIEAEKKLLEML